MDYRIGGAADARMSRGNGIRVVVVTHCSATTIEGCLRRLLAASAVAEIVVVDNASDDDTVARVQSMAAIESRLQLQVHPDNPGFAAGCNAGALGCVQPWLAFVNPDCLVQADTLVRMRACGWEQSAGGARQGASDAGQGASDMTQGAGDGGRGRRIGLLGCVQVDADGVPDGACRRRDPSLRALLLARGARTALRIASDGTPLQSVDATSGALMLLPSAVFTRVGGFDPGYRLHAEDLDLCRRVRSAGYAVAIANDISVTHLRGVSSRRRPLWVEWQKHRGLWRYFTKFEARQTTPPLRWLLWCTLWLHYGIAAPLAWWRVRRGES